jgi:hypothetical protein
MAECGNSRHTDESRMGLTSVRVVLARTTCPSRRGRIAATATLLGLLSVSFGARASDAGFSGSEILTPPDWEQPAQVCIPSTEVANRGELLTPPGWSDAFVLRKSKAAANDWTNPGAPCSELVVPAAWAHLAPHSARAL